MSLLSSLTDWLTTDTSRQQTYSEAQANTDRLNALLAAEGKNGAQTLQDPGAAGDSAGLNSFTFGILGTPDPNAAEANPNGTGVAALLKDVLVLAFIGGAIYLFVKLGGINQIKKLVS